MITDKYLQYIQLNEGFWQSIKNFFEFPHSKHPKYTAVTTAYETAETRCRRQYSPKKDIEIKIGDKFTYRDYVENPEYILCEMRAALQFWSDVIKWFKSSTSEEVCKFNTNKERCIKWVEETKLEGESELANLKGELKNTKMSKQQFDKIARFLEK